MDKFEGKFNNIQDLESEMRSLNNYLWDVKELAHRLNNDILELEKDREALYSKWRQLKREQKDG